MEIPKLRSQAQPKNASGKKCQWRNSAVRACLASHVIRFPVVRRLAFRFRHSFFFFFLFVFSLFFFFFFWKRNRMASSPSPTSPSSFPCCPQNGEIEGTKIISLFNQKGGSGKHPPLFLSVGSSLNSEKGCFSWTLILNAP